MPLEFPRHSSSGVKSKSKRPFTTFSGDSLNLRSVLKLSFLVKFDRTTFCQEFPLGSPKMASDDKNNTTIIFTFT